MDNISIKIVVLFFILGFILGSLSVVFLVPQSQPSMQASLMTGEDFDCTVDGCGIGQWGACCCVYGEGIPHPYCTGPEEFDKYHDPDRTPGLDLWCMERNGDRRPRMCCVNDESGVICGPCQKVACGRRL